ncbi:LysR family transcriptional regulator [Denitrificimonas sp. JX-1]|uniref:LysR family transcriptional regulator n=1 Tax=Denitrificimonas halotolerans TaxID=3098930 RepID=A0ABU5GSZ5_9GAMM|nr:LysR family transcriptional regulator [Denitrificimonas sp. JX-1]MDY7219732.1 LysR family transcriptional regulator [Denitrificimonas sp. JX-1]
MHFDLADLRLFINIAEQSSMTQGARKSCISTAAASNRIKKLEEQIGIRLLYRNSQGVELTAAGTTLLKHARIILRQVQYLQNELSEFSDQQVGHIRIFANTTAVTDFLPEILAVLMVQHPQLSIDLQERINLEVLRGVAEGAADIGITAGPIKAQDLEVIPFSTDRLVLTTHSEHPLAHLSSITLEETLNYPHVCLQEGSSLLRFLKSQVDGLQRKLNVRIQVFGFESMCRMIEAGVGIGIMPASSALRHQYTMNLKVIQLDEPWALRERSIVVRDSQALPEYVKTLIKLLVK